MPPSLNRAEALIMAFKSGYYDLLSLTPKQQQAFEILTDKQTKALAFGGAANGGKSWMGCEWLLLSSMAYPETRYFIGREELKRLRGSTYLTFGKVRRSLGIPPTAYKYNGQDHFIQIGRAHV